jgi:hypothetical protein
MDYPVALILAIAAGREDDLLAQLAGTLDLDDGALRVTVGEVSVRFAYRAVPGAWAVPARPSSGTGQLWHLWIVQPYDDMPPSYVRAFRDRLAAWAAARQPTAQGRWHLLGPYTPAAFQAAAPAAMWNATRDSWWTIWRAESSPEGVAAQRAATDEDLA